LEIYHHGFHPGTTLMQQHECCFTQEFHASISYIPESLT